MFRTDWWVDRRTLGRPHLSHFVDYLMNSISISPFCYCNIVHFAPTSKQITYLESAKNADNDRISAHFMKWKKFSKILCYSRVIPCQINQRCTPHPLTRFFRKFVYINYMQNKE